MRFGESLGSYRGQLGLSEVRANGDDQQSIDFVGATENVARDGDILLMNFDMRGFKQNPILLWSHNSFDLPIGRVKPIKVEKMDGERRLVGTAHFVPEDLSPFADTVRRYYLADFLRAFSIRWTPLEVRIITDEEERKKLGLGRFGVVHARSELLELSAVSLPADPDALKRAVRDGTLRADDVERLTLQTTEVIRSGMAPMREIEAYLRDMDGDTEEDAPGEEQEREVIEVKTPSTDTTQAQTQTAYAQAATAALQPAPQPITEDTAKRLADSIDALRESIDAKQAGEGAPAEQESGDGQAAEAGEAEGAGSSSEETTEEMDEDELLAAFTAGLEEELAKATA